MKKIDESFAAFLEFMGSRLDGELGEMKCSGDVFFWDSAIGW